jgi:hypothetical protein
VASPRFGHHLRLTDVDRRIIERPDLNDPAENSLRRRLLRYRDDILTTIPDDTAWWAAELSGEDLAGLLAINYPAWEIYSRGTGALWKVAEALRDGLRPAADDAKIREGLVAIRENVEGISRALEEGRSAGPLILLGRRAEGPFTVIEGNKRAAALCRRHLLDGVPCQGVAAFVGVTAAPNPWLSPHAASSPM